MQAPGDQYVPNRRSSPISWLSPQTSSDPSAPTATPTWEAYRHCCHPGRRMRSVARCADRWLNHAVYCPHCMSEIDWTPCFNIFEMKITNIMNTIAHIMRSPSFLWSTPPIFLNILNSVNHLVIIHKICKCYTWTLFFLYCNFILKFSTSFLTTLTAKEKETALSVSCLLVLNSCTLLPSSSPSSYSFFWLLTYLQSSFSMPSSILWSQLSSGSKLLLKHRYYCFWNTLPPKKNFYFYLYYFLCQSSCSDLHS